MEADRDECCLSYVEFGESSVSKWVDAEEKMLQTACPYSAVPIPVFYNW